MKKLSVILASLVLFAGVSFANPVVKGKHEKQKTEKKATKKTEKKTTKKEGKTMKKGGKKVEKKHNKKK